MPVYRDKKHEDCWIECEQSGNASYIDPNGPCIKHCGEEGLANSLSVIIDHYGYFRDFSVRLNIDFYDLDRLTYMINKKTNIPDVVQYTIKLLEALHDELVHQRSPDAPSFTYNTYLTRTNVSVLLIKLCWILSERLGKPAR